jgi:TonB-dependent SusC/RagA subfamily outer membrane receptor
MQEQVVTVASGQAATANFQLAEQALALDEIVVTGTAGTARRREVGNSIAQLSTAQIENAPARNPQDLLTGRAAGVTILQNAGQPGASGTIRLRGTTSISQGNDPLIYIDGVRVFSGQTALHSSARQSTSPLNDINPNDIERIEVIKGAAATTLYGTEAASGVIQVFTKRGVAGAAQWTAEVTGGINSIGRVGPGSDPAWMWVKECRGPNTFMSDGTRFEDLTCPASGSWLRNGPVQRYSLSVRGGAEQLSYYLSGNLADEKSPIHGGGGSANGGITGNFAFRPVDPLQISLNTSYSRRSTDWLAAGDNANAFMLNVTRGAGSNFKGATGCSSTDVVCVANARLLDVENTTRGEHFITGLTVSHQTSERLTNRITVGYDYNTAVNESITPFGFMRLPLGEMSTSDWARRMLSLDYVGSFETSFGTSLRSTFSWGGQMFSTEGRTTTAVGEEFAGPGEPTLTAAARTRITGDSRQKVINAGLFLQEMMGWKDRLFVTAGLRIDGNSAFGESFGLQPYPKLSASYVLSDHDFWPAWWEAMKLRAAIGESGKAPGAFDAVRTWNPVAGDDGQPAFTPGQLGNPDLGPERSREFEAGFDAGLFGGRLAVEATYFFQRTHDALIPVSYPPSQGFLSQQLENVGVLENAGIELRADVGVVTTPNVDWRVQGTLSTLRSEAIDVGGEVITVQTFGRTFIREGYPVPAVFARKITNPDALADPIWEDDAYIGSIYPSRTVGLGTELMLFRNLTLDARGEFQFGAYMVNGNGYQNSRQGAWRQCYDVQAKMRTERDSPAALADVTALERARCAPNGYRIAPSYDAWIEPTDFFKLRSVSLAYRLPQAWMPGVRSATLRVGARNLFTRTDYTGVDPELTDYRNSLARRDYYVVPPYRTLEASLLVNF